VLSGGFYNPAMAGMMGMMNFMPMGGVPRHGASRFFAPAGSTAPFGAAAAFGAGGYALAPYNPVAALCMSAARPISMGGRFGSARGYIDGRRFAQRAMNNIGEAMRMIMGQPPARRGGTPPPPVPGTGQGGGKAGNTGQATGTDSNQEDPEVKEQRQYQKQLDRQETQRKKAEKKRKADEKAAKKKTAEENLKKVYDAAVTELKKSPYGFMNDGEAEAIANMMKEVAMKQAGGVEGAAEILDRLLKDPGFPAKFDKKKADKSGKPLPNKNWKRDLAEWVATQRKSKNVKGAADVCFKPMEAYRSRRKTKYRDADYLKLGEVKRIEDGGVTYDRFKVESRGNKGISGKFKGSHVYRKDGDWFVKKDDGTFAKISKRKPKFDSDHGTLYFGRRKLAFNQPKEDYSVKQIINMVSDAVNAEPKKASFSPDLKARAKETKDKLEKFLGTNVADIKITSTKIEITPKGSGDEKGVNADKIWERIANFPPYFRNYIAKMGGIPLYVDGRLVKGDPASGAVDILKKNSVIDGKIAIDVRQYNGSTEERVNKVKTIVDAVNNRMKKERFSLKKIIVPIRFVAGKEPKGDLGKKLIKDAEAELKKIYGCEMDLRPQTIDVAKIRSNNDKLPELEKKGLTDAVNVLFDGNTAAAKEWTEKLLRGGVWINKKVDKTTGVETTRKEYVLPRTLKDAKHAVYTNICKKAIKKRTKLLKIKVKGNNKEFTKEMEAYKVWFSKAHKYIAEHLKNEPGGKKKLEHLKPEEITKLKNGNGAKKKPTTDGVRKKRKTKRTVQDGIAANIKVWQKRVEEDKANLGSLKNEKQNLAYARSNVPPNSPQDKDLKRKLDRLDNKIKLQEDGLSITEWQLAELKTKAAQSNARNS
jgi:hypothetical protein